MSNPTPPKKISSGSKEIAGIDTKWWIIGGGASVLVVWYVYHRSKAAAQTPSDMQSTDPNAADPYGYDASGGSYSIPADNSGAFGGAVSGIAPVAPPQPFASDGSLLVPTTLSSWITEAEAALLAMGYSPDAVSGALGAVASGQPLTSQQSGAVASASGQVGAPPTTVTTSVPPPPTSSVTSSGAVTPAEHHITVHNVLVGTKVPGINRVKLAWTPVPYTKTYVLWKDGAPVARFPASTLTFTTQLLAKGKHTWWMQATNDVSHLGGNTVSITI